MTTSLTITSEQLHHIVFLRREVTEEKTKEVYPLPSGEWLPCHMALGDTKLMPVTWGATVGGFWRKQAYLTPVTTLKCRVGIFTAKLE